MKAEGKLTKQVREHLRHEYLLKPRGALTQVPYARLRLKLLNENKTIVLFFLFTSSELKSIFYLQFKPYATTFDNYTSVANSLTIRTSKSKKEYLILFTQSLLVRGVLKKAKVFDACNNLYVGQAASNPQNYDADLLF